jgi:hypothetical protein
MERMHDKDAKVRRAAVNALSCLLPMLQVPREDFSGGRGGGEGVEGYAPGSALAHTLHT